MSSHFQKDVDVEMSVAWMLLLGACAVLFAPSRQVLYWRALLLAHYLDLLKPTLLPLSSLQFSAAIVCYNLLRADLGYLMVTVLTWP